MKHLPSIVAAVLLLSACACAEAEQDGTDTHTWKPVWEWIPGRDWYHLLPQGLEYSEPRLRHGDSPSWSAPEHDDRSWQRLARYNDLPARAGIFWVRCHVRIPPGAPPLPERMMVNLPAAYEVYWDGKYIGCSGVPGGDRDAEKPGIGLVRLRLPPAMRLDGEHLVAMRISNYRNPSPGNTSWMRFYLADLAKDEEYRWKNQRIIPGAAACAYILLAFALVLLWALAEHSSRLLWLGALFASSALLQLSILINSDRFWTYEYLEVAGHATTSFYALICLSLVGFSSHHWPKVHRGIALSAVLVAFSLNLIAPPNPFTLSVRHLLLGAHAFALLCALHAVHQGMRSAWFSTAGIFASIMLFRSAGGGTAYNFGVSFFLNALPLHLSLITAVAFDLRTRRLQARQAELTAARLKVELLRKNLQPHFLLNTLTALSQLVEECPRKAAALISDLGEEFHTLSSLSSEQLIPIETEITLCRAHLRIMSIRTERDWQLDTHGLDPAAKVPPALFLTLIENSFSHQEPIDGFRTFILEAATTEDAMHYAFFAPGSLRARHGTPGGGTGLRYVKSRLDEAWPDRWELSHGPVPNGWQTSIVLKNRVLHAHSHR